MELRHLRYFLAVAETLNFSRAAEQLRVAQPALSKQIRDLEEEMGVKLFRRSTTRVALTEAGNYFRQQAEKVVAQLQLAVTGAQELAKGMSGKLSIGTDWSVPGPPIAATAKKLRELHKKTAVQFVELRGHLHVSAVRDGRIDIGFVPAIFIGTRDDLELRHLYTQNLKVALPKTHRFANRGSIKLRELKEERWLVLDESTLPGFRTLVAQIMRPAQFTPKFGHSASSMPSMLAYVTAGDGIALLPDTFAAQEHPGISFLDTDCAPIEIFAVWLKAPTQSLASIYVDLLMTEIAAASAIGAGSPRKRVKGKG